MKRLVTQIVFGRICGITNVGVHKALKGRLKGAAVGKSVDIDHPAAIKYMRGRDLQQPIEKDIKLVPELGEKIDKYKQDNPKWFKIIIKEEEEEEEERDLIRVPAGIEDFIDYTLRELIVQFGTDIRFVEWLKATKEIEIINEKRIKNAVMTGKLVSRDLVKKGIYDPVNSAHTRLLTDGSKTIAKRVVAKHEAGANIQELEVFVSEQIATHFKAMKQTMNKTFEHIKKKTAEALDIETEDN
jgi:hypothetical protein